MENLPAVAGADASDVLRKVPMVSVDGNGSLMVRGSGNVKLLIDGKPSEIYAPSVADALRTIRGDQIVKVEVITDPSSRYDAEGTDAVVNIITRKPRQNTTNGNIGGMLGNRSENFMGDIHHQQGALQVHGDAFYQRYRNQNGVVLQRNGESFSLRQQTETRQTGVYFYGGFNLLYSLDSLNTLNAGYRYRRAGSSTTSNSDNYDQINTIPALLFRRTMETPGGSEGGSFTLGFNGRSPDRKTEYALLGLYTPSKNRSDYTLQQYAQNTSSYNETFFSTGNNKDGIIQADLAHTFTAGLKWETGGKLTIKDVRNDNQYQPDAGRSAIFAYNSQISAVYTNMSFGWGKWSFSAGTRYERTGLSTTFKNSAASIPSFSNVIPQALIQLAVDNKTSLKLSYTQKIVRPFVSYLDPTVNTSDSLTLQHGNPNLVPEITKRYQFSYSVNSADLFRDVVLFFNDNRNTIENIRTPLANGRFESTWKNLGKNQRLGLSATVNWKPGLAFVFGGTLTVQYARLASPALAISNGGLMRQLTLNASYKLPAGYSVDFYGYFDANNLSLQGHRAGWKFYNMTLNKKFKNERLNLSLRGEAFFTRHVYIDEVIAAAAYTQRLTTRYQTQNLRLTFSYKIGKREVKAPQVRTVDQ
ncbi:TonB-dependent receptor [Mucilaginibacter mali]|uniref:TonB-dependent receptor n=1 Tax=Mucilaginibacter mali TaxID=2740462 RepID=A0A7D4UBI7_9SPHI|nr:outer membrane beta-barrel family protein [Mucilaginibacter mali]QKJ30758.1 TonB-dependent receptor [Mucilaginibacter mali]